MKQSNSTDLSLGDSLQWISSLSPDFVKTILSQMFLIRHFETRAEAAYQQGKIGGFFHAYTGQEAIQTAAVAAFGVNNWYATSYRCHALALLLGATPNELMAELFGRIDGNAKGRGGSMHFFTERLMGGFGIVAGQVPIATGAAFALKYQEKKEEVAVCFMGEGAVAQGAFHESLNLAALWDLPCIYIIENNQWGMGTAAHRAISVDKMAEKKAIGYGIKGYTFDGMDFFACYKGFKDIFEEVKSSSRPVLIEVLTERFKGHSVSDPAAYRSKECLKEIMQKDPLLLFENVVVKLNMISKEEIKQIDAAAKQRILEALTFAENSPWPDPLSLEEDLFAP